MRMKNAEAPSAFSLSIVRRGHILIAKAKAKGDENVYTDNEIHDGSPPC